MDTPSRDEMIDSLVGLLTQLPNSGGMVITASGTVPSSKVREVTEKLRAELLELDYERLKARYTTYMEARRKLAEAAEAKHFFNQPHGRANFDHWAKMEYWTIDEGIALLLGRAPEVMVWDRVKHIGSPVVWQFASIREAAQRAVNWKTLYPGNRPGAFILWAKRFEYPVPEELETKVQKFGHFMGDWCSNYKQLEKNYEALKVQYQSNAEKQKQLYEGMIAEWKQQFETLSERGKKNHEAAMQLINVRNSKIAELQAEIARLRKELEDAPKDDPAAPNEKPLGQRAADSLRKLVIGLAIEGYKYDPAASRSEIPAEIARDLQRRGLDITDDTVRKHLKESAELLPREAPEPSPTKR